MRSTLRAVPQISCPFALSALAMARPIPELAPVRKIRFINSALSAPKVEPRLETEDGEEGNRRSDLPRQALEQRPANNRGHHGNKGRDEWWSDVAPRSPPPKHQSQRAVAQNAENNVRQKNAKSGAEHA